MITPTLLTISGLTKRFGTTIAVDDVSFDVRAGEVVALLGRSGAGKSTLFRCLTQLTRPDAGEVRIAGRSLNGLNARDLRQARQAIGFVFQQFNLIGRMSALDNVLGGRIGHASTWRVVMRRFTHEDRQLALSALESVGLLARAYQRADSLSGGQQQRVAIARVIAQQCKVVLADEPVASLDPATSETVLEALRETARRHGVAVLCSLHQTDLAAKFADRIVAMQAGRVVLNLPAAAVTPTQLEALYLSA